MSGAYSIRPGQWAGLQQIPFSGAPWDASPIYVVGVKPLKSGKSILQFEYIQVLHRKTAVRKTLTVKVIDRSSTGLIGTYYSQAGDLRRAAISEITLNWIMTNCACIWEKRPPRAALASISKIAPNSTEAAQEYLKLTFGEDEYEALTGMALRSVSTDGSVPRNPNVTTDIDLSQRYAPFDSWLITRGFKPGEDDRWIIYMEGRSLFFRRSWTGYLIYKVDTSWIDDRLILNRARVNRDPDQYEANDDAHYRQEIVSLIDNLILRAT